MRRKNKLLVATVGIVVLLATLGVTSMSASTAFVSPTTLAQSGETYQGDWVNLEGSVRHLETTGETITFEVTDRNYSVPVVYDGVRPETLQNGRVVVAKGRYEDGRLIAKQLSVRAHEGSERPDGTR